MGIRGSLKVLGWEVAQRELNVLLFVHLHSLIFQRYTKQSLKRNSMKWTMHMCLLQPQLMGTWYKKKKKSTKCKTLLHCQQLTKTAVFYFFSLLKQVWFSLRYFSVPWLNIGGVQTWEMSLKAKFVYETFEVIQHLQCLIWWISDSLCITYLFDSLEI